MSQTRGSLIGCEPRFMKRRSQDRISSPYLCVDMSKEDLSHIIPSAMNNVEYNINKKKKIIFFIFIIHIYNILRIYILAS
jgi:hypothetical protein